MSLRKAFNARTRWQQPSDKAFHAPGRMMRGMMSNGIERSTPVSSPYTANVMPWRAYSVSASFCFCSMNSTGLDPSQFAKAA
jgi:hypothetical protein